MPPRQVAGNELRLCSGRFRADLLPASYASRVEVHEIRLCVIADAAALHLDCGVPEPARFDTTKPHVDGLAEHVLAVARNARALGAEHLVGFR